MGADQPSEPGLGASGLWQGVPTLRPGEEAAVTPRGHATAYPPLLVPAPERGSRDRRMRTTTLPGALGKPARARRQRGPGSRAVHLLDVFPHLGTIIADHQQLQGMVHESVLQGRERLRSGTCVAHPAPLACRSPSGCALGVPYTKRGRFPRIIGFSAPPHPSPIFLPLLTCHHGTTGTARESEPGASHLTRPAETRITRSRRLALRGGDLLGTQRLRALQQIMCPHLPPKALFPAAFRSVPRGLLLQPRAVRSLDC